jgi:hypothetical protein
MKNEIRLTLVRPIYLNWGVIGLVFFYQTYILVAKFLLKKNNVKLWNQIYKIYKAMLFMLCHFSIKLRKDLYENLTNTNTEV